MTYTDQEKPIELMVDLQLGIQNALAPTSLPKGGYLVKRNAMQTKIGSNSKRPGSTPVTSTALGALIQYLTEYRFANSVAAGAVPVLSAVAGTATLPTATYYVRYTYVTDNGETEASAEASQAITLGEKLHIVIPAIPYHANSINVYISSTTNTEKKEYNTATLITEQIIPLVGTAAYHTTNSTAFSTELLAASGTSLYSLYNGELHAATMTNALVKSDIYTLGFTDVSLVSILFITDGGSVKQYDGSAVANITPAADEVSPAPPNYLATINTFNPIYSWTFKGSLFVSSGNDGAWHSKYLRFDYFPNNFFTSYVRNNDYITGCGVPFGDVCLIPMRRGWGVTVYDSVLSTLMTGEHFLNTISGNVAPRAIAKLTYPDGSQTVAYLSDDGYYEVYDTGFIDPSGSGTRNLATRSLMKDKVDFTAYGFTDAEKTAAEACFDTTLNLYISTIKRGAINYGFVYDVRSKEWELWDNIRAESTIRFNGILYYAGSTKLLHKYDATLATDYDDFAQTTGTIVVWDCYTDLIELEDTGYQSYLDWLVVSAKNFATKSSCDIYIITFNSTTEFDNAVRSQYMTWGVTNWGEAVWANLNFTNQVGAPPRTKIKKKSFFFQIHFSNPRDELFELYKYKLIGRVSGG